MENDEIGKAADAVFEIFAGALIGVDVIALIQLVGLPDLDRRLSVALYSFTASLPLLAFFVISILVEKTRDCSIDIWYKYLILVLGLTGALLGMGSVIFHLSQRAGAVFSVLCFLALILTPYHTHVANRHRDSR